MTALVMASEVDLALDRILSVCNAAPATASDRDYDVTNISDDQVIGGEPNDFGKPSAAPSSPQKDTEPVVDIDQETKSQTEWKELEGSPSGGGRGRERKVEGEDATKSTYEYLIDDAILSLVFEAHRAAKTGLYFLYESMDKEDEDFGLVIDEQRYVDVFGQLLVPSAKNAKALSQLECVCPQCHQTRLACRFAPHLEKCMGMGRNSSRIASRRLAAAAAANANSSAWRNRESTPTMNGRESSDDGGSDDGQFGSDDDDDDWTMGGASANGAFGRKKGQRKRTAGVGSAGRTPRKRGGTAKVTPKKTASNAGLRSGGDLLLNESPAKSEGTKKMRKTSSYSKLPAIAPTSNSYDIDMEMGTGVDEFLSLADPYDPPSPSF